MGVVVAVPDFEFPGCGELGGVVTQGRCRRERASFIHSYTCWRRNGCVFGGFPALMAKRVAGIRGNLKQGQEDRA